MQNVICLEINKDLSDMINDFSINQNANEQEKNEGIN